MLWCLQVLGCDIYCAFSVYTFRLCKIIYHIVSHHILSYHNIYHISYQTIPYHHMSHHHISYHIVSYHTISYIVLYHVSCHVMYHVMSCVMVCHVSCHIMYHGMYHGMHHIIYHIITYQLKVFRDCGCRCSVPSQGRSISQLLLLSLFQSLYDRWCLFSRHEDINSIQSVRGNCAANKPLWAPCLCVKSRLTWSH